MDNFPVLLKVSLQEVPVWWWGGFISERGIYVPFLRGNGVHILPNLELGKKQCAMLFSMQSNTIDSHEHF